MPVGQACAGCVVQVRPSAGSALPAVFTRIESQSPAPGDGRLQHSASDSLILTWVNPENALDMVQRSYPFQTRPSTLALISHGVAIEEVTADESGAPLAGDGILQHLGSDSLILLWVNPANPAERIRRAYPYRPIAPTLALYSGGNLLDTVTPAHAVLQIRLMLPLGKPCLAQRVRRAWPYVHFENSVGLIPHNSVAQVPGAGACCRVLPSPVTLTHSDSSRWVDLIVEASREFSLDVHVFSNLGQFVNSVSFTVPKNEFNKLAPMPGKETRFLRLLWNGLTLEGDRSGTGDPDPHHGHFAYAWLMMS